METTVKDQAEKKYQFKSRMYGEVQIRSTSKKMARAQFRKLIESLDELYDAKDDIELAIEAAYLHAKATPESALH